MEVKNQNETNESGNSGDEIINQQDELQMKALMRDFVVEPDAPSLEQIEEELVKAKREELLRKLLAT